MPVGQTNYLAYEFTKITMQTVSAVKTATSATTIITAGSAHSLAVGDAVTFTVLGGMTGITVGTTYYVVTVGSSTTFSVSATRGGSAISVGTGSGISFKNLIETQLYKAAEVKPKVDSAEYKWEGDGTVEKLSSMLGISFDISLDAIPVSAHATIFGKTALTGSLPGGIINAYGYGGGNDRAGVSVGARFEGNAVKDVGGARSNVTFVYWLPVATLTLSSPPGLKSGAKADAPNYNLLATKTTTDLLGGAITGVSSDGEFYIIGEF